MRLILDGTRITISVGLLPINYDELKKCIANNLQVTLAGTQGAPLVYRVDWSRFAPNMTTWLDMPTQAIAKLSVAFSPDHIKPKF